MEGGANHSSQQLFWWQQMPVRLRRLWREGFREFLLSMLLAMAAAILCSVYLREKGALDRAMREETTEVVGTRQEPADSAQELGLIATALAKVNAEPDFPGWECPSAEPNCLSYEKLPGELVHNTSFGAAAAAHLDEDGDWTGASDELDGLVPHGDANPLSWPEVEKGSFCEEGADHTYLMAPAQMSASHPPYFNARMAAGVDVSKLLFGQLEKMRHDKRYEKVTVPLVQAYFISPDSVLRIWNPRGDPCTSFPRTRLWAAKNYFVQFWEGGPKDQDSTAAYIDYGGNGLVRTSCHVVELPYLKDKDGKGRLATYPRGHFLGIFCMDFQLPPDRVDLMRHQLFFETADVTFPIEGNYDIEQLTVTAVAPEESKIAAPATPAAGSGPVGAGVALTGSDAARHAETQPDDDALRRAIRMQPSSLDTVELRKVLYDRIMKADRGPIERELIRVYYHNKTAFLLPLGISGSRFHALFYYPRSPRLRWTIDCLGVIGFLCAGWAIGSLIINRGLQFQIAGLREHLSLLRSLQAGVVKGNASHEITECNDRAEELCGRKMPKPGVRVEPAPHFFDMFEVLAKEKAKGPGYEPIDERVIGKIRDSGKASSYYARLSAGQGRKWLFVRATPIMEPEEIVLPRQEGQPFWTRRKRIWQMARRGSFATITDACGDRADALNRQFP